MTVPFDISVNNTAKISVSTGTEVCILQDLLHNKPENWGCLAQRKEDTHEDRNTTLKTNLQSKYLFKILTKIRHRIKNVEGKLASDKNNQNIQNSASETFQISARYIRKISLSTFVTKAYDSVLIIINIITSVCFYRTNKLKKNNSEITFYLLSTSFFPTWPLRRRPDALLCYYYTFSRLLSLRSFV